MLKLLPRNFLFVLVAGSCAALAAGAQTVPAGAGTLSGSERLEASGCGKDTDTLSVAVALAADGSWSADLDGDVYTGTSQTQGRVVRLILDNPSLSELELEDEATGLCQTPVTIASLAVTQAQLKVNKRRTAAKLQLKLSASGSTAVGSGNGKYRLKVTGPWQ